MSTILQIGTNPAFISVIVLCILCLKKVNVLLAIIISTIVAGLLSGMHIKPIMDTFIAGMGGNSETALSYILLGAFAATMTHSGFTDVISNKIAKIVCSKKFVLLVILTLIAMASQNIIPIHIAFIPIIIPPLLSVMNKIKLDRRAVACVLAFGLKMPYITLPVGFGLIFQNLIADNMIQNGVNILRNDVWKSTLILGIGMLAGLLIAVFITYRKPREYNDIKSENYTIHETKFLPIHWFVIIATIATFLVQLITKSLPLGALVGLGIIFSCKVIPHEKMDNMMDEGICLMGFVAFVMLVAAGYASVLKSTGAIDSLVNSVINYMPHSIILTSLIILILGLFITIGIGTSFGTIPIIAVLFIPICSSMGFSPQQIILLIAAAAALGDAGSPASDTTLGPTAGLNADGQHNHIFDTCIPTFLHFNIALILFALIGIWIFGLTT